MTKRRILVLGNTTVDHVFTLDAAVPADAKAQARDYRPHAGGQAANVAATLGMLGEPVDFIGRFGDDEGGVLSRHALAAAGVDLALSRTVPGCRHYTACIIVAGRQRTIVMYRDPRLSLDDLDIPAEAVRDSAAVYTDGHEGEASLRLACLAATFGTPLIVDIEVVTPQTRALAAGPAHVVAPAEVIRQMGGTDDLGAALRTVLAGGPAAVVATMGAEGSLCLAASLAEPVFVPAEICAVVDTTGAGDAFHAGYVAALLRGEVLAERLRFATRLAAAKCGIAGPRVDAAACRALTTSG